MSLHQRMLSAGLVCALAALCGSPASAAISGLDNGAGYQVNSNGAYTPTISGGTATLTTPVGGIANSIFYMTPQGLGNFDGTYTYTATSGADGAAFIIQNAGAGDTALGSSGGGLGYGGISPSVALEYNLYNGHTIGSAIATNGATGTYFTTGPVNIVNSATDVHYNYNGIRLKQTLSQGANQFVQSKQINLLHQLNTAQGYVGFSGGTGGVTSTQSVSNFAFNKDPNVIGSFASTLDDGVTPAGATLYGVATLDTTGGYSGGKLTLTTATGSVQGSMVLGDLAPGKAASGFKASFDLLQGGGGGAADGTSFTFGAVPGGSFGENGPGGSHSLTVSFDTYNNLVSGDERGIKLIVNGGPEVIGTNHTTETYNGANPAWATVFLDYSALENTLKVTFVNPGFNNGAGQTTTVTFDTTGFTPLAGDVFGFGARTGGANDNHFVDNVIINETVPEPASMSLLALGGLTLITRRRRRA